METLKLGSKGGAVKNLQDELNKNLFPSTPVTSDGIFGPVTESVVKQFQRSNGLTDDGIVGPKTWAVLKLLAARNAPPPPAAVDHVTPEGIALIKYYEGCKLQAYRDSVGVLTIGYGHTKDVYPGEHISQAEAESLFTADLALFCNDIAPYITKIISDNQFSALVSFAYNLGVGALAHSTLLHYVNLGNFQAAAAEFHKWNHGGGTVLDGLTARRLAERDLFLKV